jgi:hypothetical protein
MNQPTREEFDELKQEVRQLAQQTEPIELKIVRGLPVPEATLLQNIMDQVGKQGPDVAQLKVDMNMLKSDVSSIMIDVARLNARVGSIESMVKLILARLPEKE